MARGTANAAGSRGREIREAYWRSHVSDCARSGMAVRGYCALHGISVSSFYCWRRQVTRLDRAQANTVAEAAPFCEVKWTQPAPVIAPCALEVVTAGGRTVRVHPGFDAGTFSSVVSALEQLGC
jgi:hypothetical protein